MHAGGRLRPYRLALPVVAVLLLGAGCSFVRPSSTQQTQLVFDTACTVTVFERQAETTLDAVFEEMHRIDEMMNAHDEDSVVSLINSRAGGTPTEVSEELYRVVETGIAFAQVTGGAFDPTVGPLVELWDIGGDAPQVPSRTEIGHVLGLIDYRDVLLLDYERQVLLKREGMRLDLGGIAKGYAADRAVEVLGEMGVERALIDFGGNIYAVGEKEGERPWRIGIQNPHEPRGNFIGILEVRDVSVVTSGVYERFFEAGGVRYHHILDPESGRPVRNGLSGVTIIAASSMTADALATAVFVMGVVQGRTLVESFDGVECILVTDTRDVYLSGGIAERFALTDDDFRLVGDVRAE